MTLQECYEYLEADYEGVMRRLMKEERIIRFLKKLLDEPLYDVLQDAVGSELCESMRHGEPQVDIAPLMSQVKEDYDKTIEAVKKLVKD